MNTAIPTLAELRHLLTTLSPDDAAKVADCDNRPADETIKLGDVTVTMLLLYIAQEAGDTARRYEQEAARLALDSVPRSARMALRGALAAPPVSLTLDDCAKLHATGAVELHGRRYDSADVRVALDPPPEYLAIFPAHWGRGLTPDEALQVARKHGGRGRDYFILRMPSGAHSSRVDEHGGQRWRWAPDADRSAKPIAIAARGRGRNFATLHYAHTIAVRDGNDR